MPKRALLPPSPDVDVDTVSDDDEAPPLVEPDTQPAASTAITASAAEFAARALSASTTKPPLALKKKRGNAFLTNEQRQALCLHAATAKCTQAQLCVWARDAFALAEPLNQSTVSRILADRDKYLAIEGSSLAQKRRTYVEHPDLEAALAHWLLVASHSGQRVQGDAIKEKGRAFAQMLGIESKISFSNGWLTGFKKRHHAVLAPGDSAAAMIGSAGEESAAVTPAAADGSCAAVDFGPWSLQQAIQDYSPSDVFTVGVTGLLYTMVPEKPPRRPSASVNSSESPFAQEKLTLLLAANAAGSERLDPLFIGRSKHLVREVVSSVGTRKKQQAAVKTEEAELSFTYCYSERAWMNAIIFQRWLCSLNAKMKVAGRFILLLIDDAPSHITRGLKLSHIRVLRIPSDSVITQPLQAGIFTAFKRRYRRRQVAHALDRHEAGETDIFSVAEVQAIKWCCAAWRSVPAALVVNSWVDSNVFGVPMPRSDATPTLEEDDELEVAIKEIAARLPLKRAMTVKEILFPLDESESLHFVGTSELDYLAVREELPWSQQSASSSAATAAATSADAGDAASRVVEDAVLSGGSSSHVDPVAGAEPAEYTAVTATTKDRVGVGSIEQAEEAVLSPAALESDPGSGAGSATAFLEPDDSLILDGELLAHVQKIVPNLERLGCDERTIQAMRDVRQTLKQRIAQAKAAAGSGEFSSLLM